MAIVKALKENGANTVGIRFEELPPRTVEKYRGKGTENLKQLKVYFLKIIQLNLLQLLPVKVA